MSLISVNNMEPNVFELEFKIEPLDFDNAINSVYTRRIKNIAIPGFRKGKAPRKMAEKIYGDKVFYEDAINYIYPKELQKAVEQAELELVTAPDVEVLSADLIDGVVIKAICTTKPEIEISNYRGIKIDKHINPVTDVEIDEDLQKMRDRNARVITVDDRAAQLGDETVIDFEGFLDNVPFEGGKGVDHSLVLGSNQFIPGFEEQIVGHLTGENFEINVVFPDDYSSADFAGKSALFKINLKEIKMKEFPDLDDEFAKDVSEFSNLDDLKADIKVRLEKELELQASQKVESDTIDAIIENISGSIPQVMYENKLNELIKEFENRLKKQGMSLELYIQYAGTNMESFRETFRAQAVSQVKVRLALEKIAELESIAVSEQDITDQYDKLSEDYKMDISEIKKYISQENIAQDIKVQKAVELVKDSIVLNEITKLEEDKSPTAQTTSKSKANSAASKKSADKKITASSEKKSKTVTSKQSKPKSTTTKSDASKSKTTKTSKSTKSTKVKKED